MDYGVDDFLGQGTLGRWPARNQKGQNVGWHDNRTEMKQRQ